ncbi:uncharacterized protein LOC131647076 [Vicia villosa]|uniref:uncharacterized protein LOC131647076 n=1 Tax=Vicia villosa TaxID=3911 RepID=UPI00273C51E9|nr:uncharacterized protein LOC131647076 [Vicia villosa]
MAMKLTEGAIARICSNDSVYSCDPEFHPTLQVIGVESRCVMLSDGLNSNVGLLVGNLFNPVFIEKLQKWPIIILTHYKLSRSMNRVIFILECDVVLDNCGLIGEPVPLPNNAPSQSDLDYFISKFSDLKLSQETKPALSEGVIEIMCNDNLSRAYEFKPIVLQGSKIWCDTVTCLSDGKHCILAVSPTDLADELMHNYNVDILSSGFKDKLLPTPNLNRTSFVLLTNYKLHECDGHKFIVIYNFRYLKDAKDHYLVYVDPIHPFGRHSHNPVPKIPSTWKPVNLSQGAIEKLFSDNFSSYEGFKPVLQVILTCNNYLLLSDGFYINYGHLSSNLSELRLHNYSIIKITDYSVDLNTKSRRIFTILSLDVILPDCCPIGEPTICCQLSDMFESPDMIESPAMYHVSKKSTFYICLK